MILAGIDAGGTATKCILLNQAGEVLAQSQAGPANYQVVGLENAIREINIALKQACVEANIEYVDILGIGMAGAGSEVDRQKIKAGLFPLEKAKNCYLTDDGEIAVLGAHSGKPGLVTIAGTGSIVYGVGVDGSKARGGGWGPLLGDEGSGFWIGITALKAIIKAGEERGPQTVLTDKIVTHLHLENLRQLVPLVYQERLPRKEIASLAPLVIEAVEEGDQVARRIIDQGLDELVLTVQAVYQKMGENAQSTSSAAVLKTAVIGGVFNNLTFFSLFQEKLKVNGYQVIRPQYPPVWGAAFYGAKEAGIEFEIVKEG